jgi:hypothetical protein
MPDLVSTVEYGDPSSTAILSYTDRRTTLPPCKIPVTGLGASTSDWPETAVGTLLQ